ncbi:MAG: ParB/RepB/Spo0J family partition protein [Firmicutes bacterium]|jgi:ParB family chromosome partitioning protein|nr:ParB/RepB/Spo0J family partition protein [Bacillota bacterium]NLO66126.1 ParB/RepB/Spo0J family partition protein [Bacillota bacterium]
MSTQRLGKGLRALIPQADEKFGLDIQDIALDKIEPNPYQPRQHFDQARLEELAQSIKEFGLLEPVIVRRKGTVYELAAGERRVRAAQLAGLEEIPAIVRDYDDLEMMQVGLIENLQRENLNPIEEAEGFRILMDKFGLTQNEVAEAVGKSRPSVANALRLLNLGDEERRLVETGELSVGHAKVLLGVGQSKLRLELARRVVKEGLSVRQLEQLVEKGKNVPRGTSRKKDPEIAALEDDLQRHLGTKVSLSYRKGTGKISISYYSDEELERLLDMLRSL